MTENITEDTKNVATTVKKASKQKLTKNFQKAYSNEYFKTKKKVSIEKAVDVLKEIKFSKFSESFQASFVLAKPKKGKLSFSGFVTYPNSFLKEKRILAIVPDNLIESAKSAGALFAGGIEYLEKIQNENWFDFDLIVTVPKMMTAIGKVARILGPKGLMPSQKLKTVTDDVENCILEFKKGKYFFKVDSHGNLNAIFAKDTMNNSEIIDNFNILVKAINSFKPQNIKGKLVLSCNVSLTMSPSVRVEI
ncbi:hypothetical protein JTY60_00845 [symbiont of Argiope bruennichi]|uniref:hypothetical protein n=1 Tax=symbiont of Argiope bruennichi TaxID=2810479 RepID=UPI003DA4A93F